MKSNQHPTQSSLLAKNTIYNLFGYGSPLVVALFCIPRIVAGIGTDRFGMLTLAWVLIGYFGLLDLGLGRALTKIVAEKLGTGETQEIPSIIWTGLIGMLAVAIVIGIGAMLGSRWLVYDLLKVPSGLQPEIHRACLILFAFVPAVTVSVGFRGVLEAYQRFDLVNCVRIPLGIFSFLAPVAVIPFTVKLPAIILAMCLIRIVAAFVQFIFCTRIVTGLLQNFTFNVQNLRGLLVFGSWMTVTNIISPLLVYLDRLAIGSLISMSAVAYYATPSEVVTKLTLVSGALMSALFPAISSVFQVDRHRSAVLLERGMRYVYLVIAPIVLIIVAFAPEGLALWLDERFVENSLRVTQILATGVFFCCLGQIPYAFIQGAGRPDLTAKMHLLEAPIYIILLLLLIHWGGITGAAIAWTFRFMANTTAMYLIAGSILGRDRQKIGRVMIGVMLTIGTIVLIGSFSSLSLRAICLALSILLLFWFGFQYILTVEERTLMKNRIFGR